MQMHMALTATLLALALVSPATSEGLRYTLAPGDCLTYERTAQILSTQSDAAVATQLDRVRIWALSAGPEGTLALVELARTTDGRVEPPRFALLTIDERGARSMTPAAATRVVRIEDALDALPPLTPPAQAEDRWVGPPDPLGRRHRSTQTARGGELARFEFTIEWPAGVAELLGLSRSGAFVFDLARGHVQSADSVLEDRRRAARTKSVVRFVDRQRYASEWAVRRTAEAARVEKLYLHEDRLIEQLATRPGEWLRTRDQLEQLWQGLRASLPVGEENPFAALADGRAQVLRASASQIEARAALGRRWMNRPAFGWTLDTPDGQRVLSEEVRRGVVIECFWSSDSETSIRALQALRTVRDRLDPPYAARIVCLNVDTDLPRALQACRGVGGDLPQVLAGALLLMDPLPELPVVRVIDKQGMVRGLWVGWQAEYSGVLEQALELSGFGRR